MPREEGRVLLLVFASRDEDDLKYFRGFSDEADNELVRVSSYNIAVVCIGGREGAMAVACLEIHEDMDNRVIIHF